jgi:hypothetical protein
MLVSLSELFHQIFGVSYKIYKQNKKYNSKFKMETFDRHGQPILSNLMIVL